MDAPALKAAYDTLRSGTLWHNPAWTPTNKKCAGYRDANSGEAAKIDQYVADLVAGKTPAPPVLATATGRGIVGIIEAMRKTAPAPAPSFIVSLTETATDTAIVLTPK